MCFPLFFSHKVFAIWVRCAVPPLAIWKSLYVATSTEPMWCWRCISESPCTLSVVVFHFATAAWTDVPFSFLLQHLQPFRLFRLSSFQVTSMTAASIKSVMPIAMNSSYISATLILLKPSKQKRILVSVIGSKSARDGDCHVRN